MTKLIWKTSKLNPPYWWQLHLAGGMITISIQYREKFYSPTGETEHSGYHVQIGQGYDARRNILPSLPEAKTWGIQAAKKVLKEIRQEFQPEIPWLLLTCLGGAIALHIIWMLLFN
ncbi:MAG: hypothetical protein V7L23_12860 [Nostoc sp.]|uniref:hypothetical protein n=1 Tax=Nostoc sp. TaxID=1180 RepID=UPI002FF2EF85